MVEPMKERCINHIRVVWEAIACGSFPSTILLHACARHRTTCNCSDGTASHVGSNRYFQIHAPQKLRTCCCNHKAMSISWTRVKSWLLWAWWYMCKNKHMLPTRHTLVETFYLVHQFCVLHSFLGIRIMHMWSKNIENHHKKTPSPIASHILWWMT